MNLNEVSLAVMYLLQEVGIPLNAEQISLAFDEDSGYTYIAVALAVNSLTDKELLSVSKEENGDFYSLTLNGRLILSRLKTEIRNSLRKHLSQYAEENYSSLRLLSKTDAYISPFGDGKYQVILRSFDKDMHSTDVFIMTEDLTEAERMVENWKKYADDAVSALYLVLMKDK